MLKNTSTENFDDCFQDLKTHSMLLFHFFVLFHFFGFVLFLSLYCSTFCLRL